MAPRRSHTKSRQGCVTCKQRHVRCSEDGPPCKPCRIRGTPCVYAAATTVTQSPVQRDSKKPPKPITAPIQAQRSTRSPEHDSRPSEDEPPLFPGQLDKRFFELQLMNRYSTTTYKSMCTPVAEDDYFWRTKVPAMALHFDFLLDGIFAVTAFEIAATYDNDSYVDAAFEFQTRSISAFRRHLDHAPPGTIEPMLCFSLMIMILALASAQTQPDAASSLNLGGNDILQSTITHFELLEGVWAIVGRNADYLANSPYISRLKLFEELPLTTLDPEIESAFSKLSDYNEARIGSTVNEAYEHRVNQISLWETCKKALSMLRECFAKCADETYSGYTLGWLNMAGDNYIKAIKSGDTTSLLLLMYWGVLCQKSGHQAWWARSYGGLLVDELVRTKLANLTDPEMKALVTLAQERVRQYRSKAAS
ncbi:uncharacterized protein PV06_02033 [Exophiala oligosperma]|uniref:Zn(2)-C6 fungal-type domain-containing protein n=1 Tax=Exophiala oligosperma TaxID=215243 RepID=A0A0D2C951_9EURO|nr:uncharacterized protein PV06_02033 [Exophiala oligosperma]KIW46357.1 hypothetical protein PV06_02033 [Exophiala oligosperma]